MTERERLIELITEAHEYCLKYVDDCAFNQEPLAFTFEQMFADHLLANGVIVPPCKVGDMLYYPFVAVDVEGKEFGEMASGEAVSFSKDNRQKWVYSRYGNGLTMWYTFDDIGKTVFLSREEAEKALERREGK